MVCLTIAVVLNAGTMTDLNLSAALTPTNVDATSFTVEIPTGWEQGKGAYGGLVLGILVRAVELAEPDPQRIVRSLAAEIPAPVLPGPARIVIAPLRRGGAVSTVRAELRQLLPDGSEEVRAHVVVVTASARPNMPTWQTVTMPQAPAWESVHVAPVKPPMGPAFGQHFEFRVVQGMPFAGAAPVALGYVRAHRPGELRSAAYITALADVWWPCALSVVKAPRPMSTLTFGLNVINNLDGLDPALPLLHSAESEVSSDGYATETRRLWGHDGRLVSINHQTFVIIK